MRLVDNTASQWSDDAPATAAQAGAQMGAQTATVLKFGSSVLTGLEALPGVVSEIYRYARHGGPLAVVVSAFAGETDRLIDEAAQFGAGSGGRAFSRHAPRLIALGEERAAALLAMACDQAGLRARVLGARQLNLRAGGAPDDAYPDSIDADVLKRACADYDVVITPGFIALSEAGEPILLGRGGSDLTAVVIAGALGAPAATLIKDVDGVYTDDPNRHADARRYDCLDWEKAREVAGDLLQPKAIDFAEARQIPIRVSCLGSAGASLVGATSQSGAPLPPAFGAAPRGHRPLAIGLAGLGVVGEGAALRLVDVPQRYRIASILIGNATKARHRQLDPTLLTTTPDKFLAEASDVVIDVLSDGAAGAALVEAALAQGVSVVTANKQAVAGRLAAFTALAQQTGAQFHYSAAVGGGAPMVETIRRARANDAIVAIDAVLNGTVNFILHNLQCGQDFATALSAAQAAGFAEADPSADLSGADAEAKIRILSFEAFGEEPAADAITLAALDAAKIAEITEAGGAWRQIARIRRHADGTIEARLAYERLEADPLFSDLEGEANALRAECANGRFVVCRGRGAGRIPTVEAVLADLGDIERARG